MKKKIVGGFLLLVAVAMLAGGIKAGGNAVAGGILLAALSAFFALRLLGVVKKKDNKAKEKSPLVYIVQGGDKYHRNSGCPSIAGKHPYKIEKSLAVSQQLTPCKKCYPK